MTLLAALKTGLPLRRPIPKHLGSGGDGWLSNGYIKDKLLKGFLKDKAFGYLNISISVTLVTEEDLFATDWDVKMEFEVSDQKD